MREFRKNAVGSEVTSKRNEHLTEDMPSATGAFRSWEAKTPSEEKVDKIAVRRT